MGRRRRGRYSGRDDVEEEEGFGGQVSAIAWHFLVSKPWDYFVDEPRRRRMEDRGLEVSQRRDRVRMGLMGHQFDDDFEVKTTGQLRREARRDGDEFFEAWDD